MEYTVKKGDTVSKLAKTLNSDVQAIAEANQLKNPDRILAEQLLYVPTWKDPVELSSEVTFDPAQMPTWSAPRFSPPAQAPQAEIPSFFEGPPFAWGGGPEGTISGQPVPQKQPATGLWPWQPQWWEELTSSFDRPLAPMTETDEAAFALMSLLPLGRTYKAAKGARHLPEIIESVKQTATKAKEPIDFTKMLQQIHRTTKRRMSPEGYSPEEMARVRNAALSRRPKPDRSSIKPYSPEEMARVRNAALSKRNATREDEKMNRIASQLREKGELDRYTNMWSVLLKD